MNKNFIYFYKDINNLKSFTIIYIIIVNSNIKIYEFKLINFWQLSIYNLLKIIQIIFSYILITKTIIISINHRKVLLLI